MVKCNIWSRFLCICVDRAGNYVLTLVFSISIVSGIILLLVQWGGAVWKNRSLGTRHLLLFLQCLYVQQIKWIQVIRCWTILGITIGCILKISWQNQLFWNIIYLTLSLFFYCYCGLLNLEVNWSTHTCKLWLMWLIRVSLYNSYSSSGMDNDIYNFFIYHEQFSGKEVWQYGKSFCGTHVIL